jgi:hypothetical protein
MLSWVKVMFNQKGTIRKRVLERIELIGIKNDYSV